ncbi:hypothetical protein Efla_007892 [Eimeria flavescens]
MPGPLRLRLARSSYYLRVQHKALVGLGNLRQFQVFYPAQRQCFDNALMSCLESGQLFHCLCFLPCTEPGAFSPFPSRYMPQVRRRAASDKGAYVEHSTKEMVSSIALLKLAYEGALTLRRSPGSLVLQNCCADNLAVDGVP